MLWRFVRSLDVLKTTCWPTTAARPMSYRLLWASALLSAAFLVVIATVVAVARIAFEEQSWVSSLVLLVTIVQVQDMISRLQFTNKSFFSHGETCTWPGSTFQVTQTNISKHSGQPKKSCLEHFEPLTVQVKLRQPCSMPVLLFASLSMVNFLLHM